MNVIAKLPNWPLHNPQMSLLGKVCVCAVLCCALRCTLTRLAATCQARVVALAVAAAAAAVGVLLVTNPAFTGAH